MDKKQLKTAANTAAVRKWRLANGEKVKAYALKRRRERPEQVAAVYRKHRYGLTNNDYLAMFSDQGGGCAICKWPLLLAGSKQEKPQVDHDHASGKVRGLLCMSCNQGLGRFKDNTDHLTSAIEYLRKTS